MNRKRKGFTLIELIVVMSVVGLFVIFAAPRYLGYTKDIDISAVKTDVSVLENTSLNYFIENNKWPVSNKWGGFENSDLGKAIKSLVGQSVNLGDIDIYRLDKNASNGEISFKNLVGKTNNDINDYFIITSGDYAGSVFYKENLVNNMGEVYNGNHLIE